MPMASGMAMDGDEGSGEVAWSAGGCGEVAWSAGGCGECRPKCQAMCSAKTKIPAQDSLPNQSTTVSRASPNLLKGGYTVGGGEEKKVCVKGWWASNPKTKKLSLHETTGPLPIVSCSDHICVRTESKIYYIVQLKQCCLLG